MPRMMRAVLVILAAAAVVLAVAANWSDIVLWAQAEQRTMQNQLARGIQAVRSGDQFAIATLVGACFLYGLLHAVGPGHGKFLIGGAAVASRRTASRMAAIGFASSLMQAVSAIAIAYGGLGLASATGSAIVGSAEGLLIPLSFAAMALVGAWIVVRGVRLILGKPSTQTHEHHVEEAHGHRHEHEATRSACSSHTGHSHTGECAAGCKHMPTVDEAEKLESWRDVAALVFSIGIRPCSGALIVLIISWHLGLYLVGALATFAMAAGTGLIVALVALFATVVRETGLFRLGGNGDSISLVSFGRLQVVTGSVVVAVCMALFVAGISDPTMPSGLIR